MISLDLCRLCKQSFDCFIICDTVIHNVFIRCTISAAALQIHKLLYNTVHLFSFISVAVRVFPNYSDDHTAETSFYIIRKMTAILHFGNVMHTSDNTFKHFGFFSITYCSIACWSSSSINGLPVFTFSSQILPHHVSEYSTNWTAFSDSF